MYTYDDNGNKREGYVRENFIISTVKSENSSDNKKTMLYVGLGLIALALIAVLFYMLMKKKKPEASVSSESSLPSKLPSELAADVPAGMKWGFRFY